MSQFGRTLISPPARTGIVAVASAAVFFACMVLGLYLANISATKPETSSVSPTILKIPSTATTTPNVQGAPAVVPELEAVASASTDFQGKAVDTNVWDIYTGKGNAGVGVRRASALNIADGALQIKGTGDVGGGLSQKFSQTYGRWVVRARMEAGQGYGPALLLWPDSEKWPQDGEIDFLELPKGDRASAVMTTHWGTDNSQVSKSVAGDYTQWHTFTIDWMPDKLVFYIDDVEQWRVTDAKAIPTKPMHLALQNDVGGCDSWIGCRNASTPKTVSLFVSSVRVYKPTA